MTPSWAQGVAGSNPVAPTTFRIRRPAPPVSRRLNFTPHQLRILESIDRFGQVHGGGEELLRMFGLAHLAMVDTHTAAVAVSTVSTSTRNMLSRSARSLKIRIAAPRSRVQITYRRSNSASSVCTSPLILTILSKMSLRWTRMCTKPGFCTWTATRVAFRRNHLVVRADTIIITRCRPSNTPCTCDGLTRLRFTERPVRAAIAR